MKNYTKDKFRDLISLYRISNSKTKKKITSFFIKELNDEFDDVLFFYVAINKIIDYSLFWDKYVNKLKPYFAHWNYERVGDNFMPNFLTPNWFVTFIYRLDIDCNLPEIQDLAKTNEYFNWLFNLSTYDYSKFKLEWIGAYTHPSYFIKLKTIPVLKQKVEELLKTNYDLYLTELYYKYF